MKALETAVLVYVLFGIIYTVYVLTRRPLSIFLIPINILGGPILVIHYFVKYYIKKEYSPARIRHKDILKDKKAAFFDLDGTIWASDHIWIDCIAEVARENGLGEIDILSTYAPGADLKKRWKVLQAYNGFKMPEKKNATLLAKETENKMVEYIKKSESLELIPGFIDISYFLKVEKDLKLALITNSSKEVTEAFVEKTGTGNTFDLILTGNDVRKEKPSPQIFLKAARKLHISPREVLVFEDSLSGSKAAARAGMDQIIIWRNDTPQTDYYGKIFGFFPDFEELDEILNAPSQQRVLEGVAKFRGQKGSSNEPEEKAQGEKPIQ
ncbi:MAG: hypothetical protein KatS3mg101_0030 [Patescibacteria group bacterium]|nr:MAG: hypothetical protein KatS3mg101_0030 [Patescibacteria group bacterium]